MLCTMGIKREQKQSYEGKALDLALTAAFASIRNMRYFTILIDKHRTSLNDINEVVGKDIYRWRVENRQRIQIGGNVLAWHIHVMKA